jgi:hypothetical protein
MSENPKRDQGSDGEPRSTAALAAQEQQRVEPTGQGPPEVQQPAAGRDGLFQARTPAFLGGLSHPPKETPPASPRKVRRSRVLIPLCLFIVLIGGIAWVSQYLPSNRGGAPSPFTTNKEMPFRFTEVKTVEDDAANGFITEVESGVEGHHDFLFENITNTAAELGLHYKQCSCSKLEVAEVPADFAEPLLQLEKENKLAEARAALRQQLTSRPALAWTEIVMGENKGVMIQPHKCGLLRLIWKAQKKDEDHLQLQAQMWIQPEGGQMKDRTYPLLKAMLALVPPVRIFPEKQDVGVLEDGDTVTKKFVYWSSTRDKLELVAGSEPCVACEIKPLDAAACRKLEKTLFDAKAFNTRVRSACRVAVTLYEHKGNNYLDRGAIFIHAPVQVKVDGKSLDMPPPAPLLRGRVVSDIEVLGASSSGKIDLGRFKSKAGVSKTVRLLAPAKVELEVQEAANPKFLEVKLAKKETVAGQTSWEVQVSAVPGLADGELPAETAVVLQQSSPGIRARGFRIHVTGSAARD